MCLFWAFTCGCETTADGDGTTVDMPTWGLVETLRIGSIDGGEYPLERVSTLLPGKDGSVLVAQSSAQEVPEFDADGRLRRVFGRSGSGPGEFGTITAIGWLADSLWIADIANQKISFFAEDGTHLSDQRVEVGVVPDNPILYRWPPHPLEGEGAVVQPGLRRAPS